MDQQQQKRSAAEAESLLVGVKSIVFDIEGTTTPLSFHTDTLLPYFKENIRGYFGDMNDEADSMSDWKSLKIWTKKQINNSVEGIVDVPSPTESNELAMKAMLQNIDWLIEHDPKCLEFQQILCHVLHQGFENGTLRGEVFEDVPPMLRMLHEESFDLHVYSSAAKDLQKDLFAHTIDGDISTCFSKFFDTNIGDKNKPDSYKKIAKEISNRPEDVLFLTDAPDEAEAAVKAGMRSALVIRPGNADLTDEHLQNFACIEQFDELYGDEDDDDIKRLHQFQDGNGTAEDDDEEENEDDDDEDEDAAE